MLRAVAVTGLVALVAPGARAEFGCYEWPSLSDPSANVAYLVATDCEADLAALASADGFSHLQQFGNEDYSESTCTNSAGMINFAELCNATKASLVSVLPFTRRIPLAILVAPLPLTAFHAEFEANRDFASNFQRRYANRPISAQLCV